VAALRHFAATALPETPSERALAALQKEVVCEVATLLGNTPSVCRKAYIDPSVFDGWRSGSLARLAGLRGERQWEQATLKFLRSARRTVKKAKAGTAR
jgi:DNA topoisomerase IB